MNIASGFTPMEWIDFSGGFTDNVYSDDTSKCALNRNLLVDRNNKTYLRPGSALYYPTHPQHPNGSNRINRFMKFPDETSLFGNSGAKLAYDTGSQFTEVTGPTGHSAFPSMATSANVSWSYWNNQYFMTNDAGLPALRVFKDSGGSWQLIQAGLPALDATQYSSSSTTALSNAITLANAIRTKVLAHFADVTVHTSASFATHVAADTVSAALVGSACTDLPTLITLTGQLLKAYSNHHTDSQANSLYHSKEIPESSWAPTGSYIGNPAPVATVLARTLASTQVPAIGEAAATLVDAINRLNDLKKCYNTHEGRVDIHGDFFNVFINPVTTGFIYGVVQGPLIQLRVGKIYDYCNLIKTKLNAHFAAATAATAYNHAAADTTDGPITTPDATTPETLEALAFDMQPAYYNHEFDAAKTSAWLWHFAKGTGDHQISPGVPPVVHAPPYPDKYGGIRAGNWAEMVDLLNRMKNAMNGHFNDKTAHYGVSAGTPNPFQISGNDLVLADYLYAFHYDYTFNVGTVANELVGPVLEVGAFGVIPTEFEALAISNLPVLSNTSSQNYATGSITISIYRTTNGGNVFYKVGSVANGTTTFTDYTTDVELITRERIYTNGGIVDHDPPPLAQCMHIVNSTGYYGYVTDAGEIFPNRIRQSVPGAPDACPGDFFDDLRDPVIGITSVQTLPIVFCSHSIYRIEGAFTDQGSGLMTHQAISDTVGLASEASIVRVDHGVFFAGTDGFYFTDGYQLKKVSDDWNRTYAGLTATAAQSKRIQGSYDQLRRQVWWSVQILADGSNENDGFVILDLNFPADKNCWTTAGNTGHFRPSAHIFYQNSLIRGHSLGYVFQHSYALTEDPYIDTGLTPANWGTKTVVFDWSSTFVSWGVTNVRKWCPMLEFNLQNDTNLNLGIFGRNDNDRSNHVLTPLKSHTHYVWGDQSLIWGDKLYLWNFQGNLDEKRYIPARSLRCTYKQIIFQNAFVPIYSSQDKGTAVVNGTSNTATLSTALKYWPLDVEGYSIAFESDGYTALYEITRKNSTTLPTVLTLADPDNTLPTGTYKWSIQGYQKGQSFHLLDFTLWGKPMSLSQTGSRQA